MNRYSRFSLFFLLSGALLLPVGLYAQEKNNQAAPADQQQDTGKKKDKGPDKAKNLKKASERTRYPLQEVAPGRSPPTSSAMKSARAFLQLQTNEEREQFIEAFWQRRDPTPDTVENEFKEEHYRRIAYANERFASGIPGWRTDRGRIYIIWGKAG